MSAHVLRDQGAQLQCILCDMFYDDAGHAERLPCIQFGAW